MHLSKSKHKFYLYLFFFVFLSSVFNFEYVKNLQDIFRLKKINVNGLSYEEKKIIEVELNKLKNTNIILLTPDKILEKLNKFNFLERIYINKVMPSSININLSKTTILGKTVIDGENFLLGENGNLINPNLLIEKNNIPIVFGNFQIEESLNLLKILNYNGVSIESIKEYYYFKNKRWDLVFSNGLKLMLPSQKREESLKIFKNLQNNNNLINTKIVDLRTTNQIILTH